MKNLITAVIATAVLGYAAGLAAGHFRSPGEDFFSQRLAQDPFSEGEKSQVLVIFIGSRSCAACQTPGLREAVSGIVQTIAHDAAAGGFRFHAIGVSVDGTIDSSLDFIREFGPFHEISVGGGWLNLVMVEHVYRDGLTIPGVPQLIVVWRHMDIEEETVRVGDPELLAVMRNADDILRWHAQEKHVDLQP